METKPGQTTEALVSSRIKQKERPIAKEKRNTVAGEIKTREPTVRSNEALKVSKERGSQTIEPSVAPSGDVKPTTKGAPLPAVQAKVISASNDQIQISQSKEMQKRKVQGESRSPVINSPRATQNSSSSTEKTNAPSKKAHEQTVKESDKIPIREKETIHPRVKEKAVKMRSDKQITQGCLFESH